MLRNQKGQFNMRLTENAVRKGRLAVSFSALKQAYPFVCLKPGAELVPQALRSMGPLHSENVGGNFRVFDNLFQAQCVAHSCSPFCS